MKRFLVYLLFSALAYAQNGSQQNFPGAPIQFAGVPSGSCNVTQTALNAATGDLYTCPNTGSVWLKVSGGGSPLGSAAGSVTNTIVQSGLLGQYDFNQNSGTTLTDVSTNGNNGTLCAAGAAPSWVGIPTGGLTFVAASSQCVTLPSALNAAATIQIFANNQLGSLAGSPFWTCLVVGNGTKANTTGLCQRDSGTAPGFSNTGTYSPAIITSTPAGAPGTLAVSANIGTTLTTWVLDATVDILYNGATALTTTASGGSAGLQTSGVYQLGGRGTGYVNSNSGFWSGTMYYALFYNRKLTVAEIAQNNTAIQQIMANRALVNVSGSTLASNVYIIDGDSLPGANGAWLQFAFPTATDGAWQALYTGIPGWGIANIQTNGNLRDDVYCPVAPGSGNCLLNIQVGTNNLGISIGTFLTQYAQYIAQRRSTGKYSQVWINTIIDRTTGSAAKDTFNTALLQSWQSMGATGIIPIGEDPNLGCDGCNTNAFFNVDHIHPSAVGQYEIAHIQQPNINRATNGNFNFSSANTYTVTAPAATAITASTSSAANLVTLTFAATPAAFVPGVDLTITGVTPAGYNTSATNVCHLLTATGTQVTCLNPVPSLGAGSVFGTASTSTQLDADATVILAGTATTPSFTLEPCISWVGGGNVQGWDGRVRIKNANTTSPWTITPFGAETIDGAASLAMPVASSGNNPVVILEAQALAASTGGCNWRRVQ